MDVDSQEDLGAMEAESAAQSIQNEGKSMVENEARGSEGELPTQPIKEQEVFVGALIYIFACSWTESVAKTLRGKKRTRPISSIFTEQAWSIKYLLYGKGSYSLPGHSL